MSAPRVPLDRFRPVRTPRVFDDVVEQILEGIRSGRLAEGDLLPGERELARRMEVSRPTLRAALRQLAEAGLLASRPGRSGGTWIASIWIPEHLAAQPSAFLPVGELAALLEARRLLEVPMAHLAAARASADDLALLRATLDLQRAHVGDRPKALQAETRFHRAMWRAAANPVVEEVLAGLFPRLEVARDTVMRDEEHMHIAVALHERTLAAISAGDAAEIDAAMDEHLAYTEELVAGLLGGGRPHRPPQSA
jgi:GntR family transcriptional repressor for pyruvate dehydrogenase complex